MEKKPRVRSHGVLNPFTNGSCLVADRTHGTQVSLSALAQQQQLQAASGSQAPPALMQAWAQFVASQSSAASNQPPVAAVAGPAAQPPDGAKPADAKDPDKAAEPAPNAQPKPPSLMTAESFAAFMQFAAQQAQLPHMPGGLMSSSASSSSPTYQPPFAGPSSGSHLDATLSTRDLLIHGAEELIAGALFTCESITRSSPQPRLVIRAMTAYRVLRPKRESTDAFEGELIVCGFAGYKK
jgi:hypothetical protein